MKELREKYLSRKGLLMLHKVEEVHAVCGLLKDFLRKLKEPLVTFKLHRAFMEASGGYYKEGFGFNFKYTLLFKWSLSFLCSTRLLLILVNIITI